MIKENIILHWIEKRVLCEFKQNNILSINALENQFKTHNEQSVRLTTYNDKILSRSQIESAIESLKSKNLITLFEEGNHIICLTQKGKEYFEKGTPEMQIVRILKEKGKVHIKELDIPDAGKTIAPLKKESIVEMKDGFLELKSNDTAAIQKVQDLINKVAKESLVLQNLHAGEQNIVKSLHIARGEEKGVFRLVKAGDTKYKLTEAGETLLNSLDFSEEITKLTSEMIKDGSWKNKVFKEYDVENLVPEKIVTGKFHPYMEFLSSVREKLTNLGFQEMTGNIVETEFWNLDALFIPQFHPAREIHSVYFVKEHQNKTLVPDNTSQLGQDVLERVAKTHENGGETGSKGWQYKYDRKQAHKLVLRSHGTAISIRTLALHPEPPGKYFAITRCFRPDAVDSTHAPDFFQIEGIVVSESVNFKSLLGLLKLFAHEIANVQEIKFIPGYFPFTEPSVELHAKHKKLGWIELGGAGIFRPEVTLPQNVKVPVLAWGLGLDRMAMMSIGIEDIRDLFSRDLEFLRKK